MSMFDNPQFARTVIMDHYENPRNKRHGEGYPFRRMDSESCIDDITVAIKFEGDVISDICFEGVGCTISTASTSIMTELMMGKTRHEALNIMDAYYKMIDLQGIDMDLLQEAVVFKNVGRQANRINCATLGWRGLALLLESERDNHEG